MFGALVEYSEETAVGDAISDKRLSGNQHDLVRLTLCDVKLRSGVLGEYSEPARNTRKPRSQVQGPRA